MDFKEYVKYIDKAIIEHLSLPSLLTKKKYGIPRIKEAYSIWKFNKYIRKLQYELWRRNK